MALRELTIRNFAIIKQLEIEFDDGLTVITGETGAGKSIVLGALSLVLGERAETGMIRHGHEQCEISALFDIKNLGKVQHWLNAHDFEGSDDHCLVRRIIKQDKPTKCYINDQPTTLASLKELGLLLVDLHGQHEHQSLLRKTTQRQIIDDHAGHQKELQELVLLAKESNTTQKQLTQLQQSQADNADLLGLLSFQLNELDEVSIAANEFDQLEQEHARLSHAQTLINGIEAATDQLFHNENKNITTLLGNVTTTIDELTQYDVNLKPANEMLTSALAQIEEAQSSLDSALTKIDLDPERLQEVESRLDTVISLARKHRCHENDLADKHESLQNEYNRLNQAHAQPELLEKQLAKLSNQYNKLAERISKQRQQSAQQLSSLITAQMQDLGMQGGELSIKVSSPSLSPSLEHEQVSYSEHGIDTIEYLVSTNTGMPLKSLQKTASGGELSRISLAIQVISSEHSNTPSLIFDEVDVGVGGRVAEIVGQKLQQLGDHAQVLCITHLPQVASQGHQHLSIRKLTENNETQSTLVALDQQERIEEIARMLGGAEITDRTLAHAQEMLFSSTRIAS